MTTDLCWATPSAGDGKGVWLSCSRARPKRREKTVDVLVDDHVCMFGGWEIVSTATDLCWTTPSADDGEGSVDFPQHGPRGEKRL